MRRNTVSGQRHKDQDAIRLTYGDDFIERHIIALCAVCFYHYHDGGNRTCCSKDLIPVTRLGHDCPHYYYQCLFD